MKASNFDIFKKVIADRKLCIITTVKVKANIDHDGVKGDIGWDYAIISGECIYDDCAYISFYDVNNRMIEGKAILAHISETIEYQIQRTVLSIVSIDTY